MDNIFKVLARVGVMNLPYIQKSWRYFYFILLSVICAIAFILMARGAYTDSAIMDELAHIPAGYGYVSEFDFRLNPEHPPLLKALSGIPVLFLRPHFPIEHSSWTTDVNGQWEMGRQFLYESGNDADAIIRASRLAPIFITILLIILIYLWAAELLGFGWALLPAFLFALSPTVLAHGHYVTTDVVAAFGFVISIWQFVKYVMEPTKKRLLMAGLAFGLAQAAKFSNVLLGPYFVILTIIFILGKALRARQNNASFGKSILSSLKKQGLGMIAIFIIGYALIIYPMYAIFTVQYPVERQTYDTTTILHNFAGGPTPSGETCEIRRCFADLNIWMTKHAITKPFAEYYLGVLMVLTRSSGGNTGYFFGELSRDGWLAYFPAVYLLKESLPALLLTLIAFLYSAIQILKALFKGRTRILDYLAVNFAEFAMVLFIVIYWAYSMKSPLNIGFRHLLPTIPFIYILTASGLKQWIRSAGAPQNYAVINLVVFWIKKLFAESLKYSFIFLLVLWVLIESLVVSPYFLSYYNQIGGGTNEGYRYVTDSNYDWGQDMLRLKEFVDSHPEIDKIGVDYFGGATPKYYLGEKEENWWSSRGNPINENIHWLAISVNTLEGSFSKLVGSQERNPQDEYRWLEEIRPRDGSLGSVPPPDFRAGTSIFIYKL